MQLQKVEFTFIIIIKRWSCVNSNLWSYIKFVKYAQNKEMVFMDFATNLKRICDERGTTPTKVCKDLGLSTNKVSLWNKGGIPKANIMVKIANHLNCSVTDFFVDEKDLIPKVEFALDEDEKDIIRLFRMLDRKQKHEFMAKAYAFELSMERKHAFEETTLEE